MRILLTGTSGQVGAELIPRLRNLGELVAVDHAACDLADKTAVRRLITDTRPEVIVNAAAFTAVNEAETQTDEAYAVNRDAPLVLASEAVKLDAMLVHYSTDYVFDGSSAGAYSEEDKPLPLNIYGASKLDGERAIAASGGRFLILRTSWVYSAHGKNFFLTIRRLAREREELKIVDDQTGAPTSAIQLAEATERLVGEWAAVKGVAFPSGTYHATASGSTTWCGFARAIVEALRQREMLKVERIAPIGSDDFPTPARRPKNSVLSNEKFERTFGFRLGDWEQGLAEVLRDLERREAAASAG